MRAPGEPDRRWDRNTEIIRRECLDHVIVFNERHLLGVLTRYFDHYHRARTHVSLQKDAPENREVEPPHLGPISSTVHEMNRWCVMIDLSHPSKASTLQVLVRSSGLAHAMLYVRRERAGFMGCDLVYVEYAHPTDGSIHELPFGTVNLEPGGYERLIELANRHEARAAAPRRMAEETPRR